MAHCEEIIITETPRGSGEFEFSPYRTVKQFYSKDGILLAEKDSFGGYTQEQMFLAIESSRNEMKDLTALEIIKSIQK